MSGFFSYYSSLATVKIFWNDDGLISRIELSEEHNKARGFTAAGTIIPAHLLSLFQSLDHYLTLGQPVGANLLEIIDRSRLSTFQQLVFNATASIPHGETRTYGWIANKIRKPFAARAIGQALKRNPFPLLIPCHRVVATSAIGGFMGKSDPSSVEIKIKTRLIEREHNYLNPPFAFAAS